MLATARPSPFKRLACSWVARLRAAPGFHSPPFPAAGGVSQATEGPLCPGPPLAPRGVFLLDFVIVLDSSRRRIGGAAVFPQQLPLFFYSL